MFVLFVYCLSNFQLSGGCHHKMITRDRAANLDLCLALMASSSEGSFSCHTYCNTGPQFIRSHPKDQHPHPTVGFEPGTQGSSDLCASALITAPRRQCDLHHFSYLYSVPSNLYVLKLNKTIDRPQPAYQRKKVAAYGPKNTVF
jgi:hypothetical protein